MNQRISLSVLLLFFLLAGAQVATGQTARAPFDITQPAVRVFLPPAQLATGRAVVACPGGGYQHLAMDHEGYDWAPYFNSQGIALIVLKYRMPHGNRTFPIADAEAAMKLARDSADVWNLNPRDIGIMGSSAGGHLASTIATHTQEALRPDFQILFYPVITMDKAYTHRGSHDNLLGPDASADLEKEYSNEKQVTAETPRAFLALSDDDHTVPPANGVNYYLALNKHGVPASLFVYPKGGHGWGFRAGFTYHKEMLADLTAWLNSFKAPRKDAVRIACVGNSITFGAGLSNPKHDSYPAVLGRLLGDGYWVKNFGVSGRTMLSKGDHPYVQEQEYQEALAFCPNIVVIQLGTNDSKPYNWVHKADFGKDMQAMVDAFKALPSQPKIYLCYPSKAYAVAYDIQDKVIVKEVIPIIKKLAKKNHLPLIDLHTAMGGQPELFPDHIHPNVAGAKVMAEAVCKGITSSAETRQ
ncbi:MAG: GDSL-type esterase/lipase family protein [Mediterranea sp.]|jgi:acetyl esterase/lipase|nr:GDSL-type esterase/lipase family protein [Mediterranea sp.]